MNGLYRSELHLTLYSFFKITYRLNPSFLRQSLCIGFNTDDSRKHTFSYIKVFKVYYLVQAYFCVIPKSKILWWCLFPVYFTQNIISLNHIKKLLYSLIHTVCSMDTEKPQLLIKHLKIQSQSCGCYSRIDSIHRL